MSHHETTPSPPSGDARRGVALTPMETRRDVIVRTAMLADELGYETFGLPEGWGLDAGPVLTEIALRTSRVRLPAPPRPLTQPWPWPMPRLPSSPPRETGW